MDKTRQARIIGTGSYLPEKVLSNADLEEIVDTSDEWISTRTGMKERRIASKEEHTSTMALYAAKKALDKAGMKAEEIDLILFATITPDYIFPSTAALLQSELGCGGGCACMDLQAACSGFIYGLSTAKSYIESGMYKNILLVASEKLSAVTDYTDRSTCVLFGDGAAAAVLSNEGAGLLLDQVCLGCDGNQAEILMQEAGGVRNPASSETVENRMHFIKMGGREVFKHAVRRMEESLNTCLEKAGLKGEDVSWMIPHQANMRIIEALAKRFNVSMEKVFVTIHKYGNTSASSVGIALDELTEERNIEEGDNLILVAFGAGLTWGSCLLRRGE